MTETTTPAPTTPSRTLPRSEADERRFNFNMGALCARRGFMDLARHYTLAAGLFQSEEMRAARLARCRDLEPGEVSALWCQYHPEDA